MISLINSKSIYIYLLFAMLTLGIEASFIQNINNIPDTDSGVFLYFGQQILKGDIPYRDMWDHKGPVIYYINAIGLFFSQGSAWGLYLMEYISLFCSVCLGYLVMTKAFGTIPAFISSILWLFAFVYVIEYGNYTEEYTLPLSFAALFLFWRFLNSSSKYNLFYIFIIGMIFSVSFLLRPNNTGVELSVALVLLISGILKNKKYHLFKQILAFILGSAAILIAVILYFEWNGALSDFYDSFIRYNTIFSTSNLRNRIESIIIGLQLLSRSGITLTALAAWIIGITNIFNKQNLLENRTTFILLGLIGLPVEFILSSISGRHPPHYYINWLPVCAILTSYLVFEFKQNFASTGIILFGKKINISHIWIFAFLIAMSFLTVVHVTFRIEKLVRSNEPKDNRFEIIKGELNDENYLLMWGAETGVNYLAGMKSPTRYVYQYPFYTCNYSTEEMIEEFLNDIRVKKPLIVDTSSTNVVIPPVDKNERKSWQDVPKAGYKNRPCQMNPKMHDVFEYLDSRYMLVDTIEPSKWKLYKYKDKKQSDAE